MAKRVVSITHIRVPAELLGLKSRSIHEVLILSLVAGFDGDGLYMSNGKLARLLYIGRRNVIRVLGRLQAKGWLVLDTKNGRRIFRLGSVIMTLLGSVTLTPGGSGAAGTQVVAQVTLRSDKTDKTLRTSTLFPADALPPEAKPTRTRRSRKSPAVGKVRTDDVDVIFNCWNSHAGRSVEKNGETITWKGHKRLSPEIATAIQRCLEAGYSVEDICGAIDNFAMVLLSPELYWSYPWPLATFLTVADGRGRNAIPKWTRFAPDNFARETYLSKRPGAQGDTEQDIGKLAGCEPADEDEAQQLYAEVGLTEE